MSHIKIIKTAEDHALAMEHLLKLMELNPEPDSAEDNELEVISLLIEQYEKTQFPMDKPDPIDAILFRMDQQGLTRKDLGQFIGSASKVSEVLNRKRPLSLSMIRKLHNGLGIASDILIQEADLAEEIESSPESQIDWASFPLKEMQGNGYFGSISRKTSELKEYAEDLVRGFMKPCPGSFSLKPAMLRSSAHLSSNDKQVNALAIWAWQVKVLTEASNQKLPAEYTHGTVDLDFMRRLASESWSEQGPLIAKEYLAKHGIHLVIEPHLDKTYLDGAVCINSSGNPVIALTLRYDRLDNFWFSLMHELAHIALHIDESSEWFTDNLELQSDDAREDEANAMAREALIPKDMWDLDANATMPEMAVLAKRLKIAPAIVYGRIAREHSRWPQLGKHIGKVRTVFN